MSKQSTKLADPLKPLDPEFLQDPYPTFDRMRTEEPVFWSESGKYWIVTRFDDVYGILKTLSYEKGLQRWKQVNPLTKIIPPVRKLTESRKKWMLNMDPPDHTRLRSLVNKAFTPSMVNGMRDHIKEIAEHLLDEVKDKEEFDLVADYCFPLPVTVIAEMLGVPASDRDKFHKWSTSMTESLEPSMSMKHMMKANKVTDELMDYLKPLVNERRKNPKDDLISALVAAEEDGQKLTEEELLNNCILLLVAGHETTVNLIGNAARCLLTNEDQLKLLKEKPELVKGAITETLRYESPVQLVRRLAHEKTELRGKEIGERDMIILLLGAANRDPDVFENANSFDITRDTKKHVAFGHGIHHCLGSSLAEAEGEIAIATLFERFPDLALKTEDIKIRMPFALRGPKELWVKTGA